MAEVKMSLAEYDALIVRLNRAESIINKLTTGYANDIYEDLKDSDCIYIYPADKLTRDEEKYLENKIVQNLDPKIKEFLQKNPDYEYTPSSYSDRNYYDIGKIVRKKSDESEEEN